MQNGSQKSLLYDSKTDFQQVESCMPNGKFFVWVYGPLSPHGSFTLILACYQWEQMYTDKIIQPQHYLTSYFYLIFTYIVYRVMLICCLLPSLINYLEVEDVYGLNFLLYMVYSQTSIVTPRMIDLQSAGFRSCSWYQQKPHKTLKNWPSLYLRQDLRTVGQTIVCALRRGLYPHSAASKCQSTGHKDGLSVHPQTAALVRQ